MVSFKNGRPDRVNYRKFKMKSVVGQNDFACMAETIRRRYTRVLRENSERLQKESGREAGNNDGTQDFKSPSPHPLSPSEGESVAEGRVRGTDEPLETKVSENIPATNPASRFLPDLILIDGGKGQLSAACEELKKLGLESIPIIGLAKEFEEIYRPGESEPLRLPHETGALKLLQRVRDESHRLANTYNASLRLRKISESILDEFPGIGERRKAALLKKFGSVQRMRLATEEQLAQVPGFGGKAAAELKAFLVARPGLGTVEEKPDKL
jgi:excinuclease ABC subunit C